MNCPVTLGNFNDDVSDWETPTIGSTDYFNGCSQAMGTPKNFNGEQPADFGVGYVGLYFYAPEDYREYIQAQLTSTLKKGERYTVSFYVSLAERSDFAIKEFGIQFLENPVQVKTRKVLSRMHLSKVSGDASNHFSIRYSDFYSDKKDWILVEKEFVAHGTENYMIIGNFKNNARTQKFKTKRNSTLGSYYYLDMVAVTPIGNFNRESGNTQVETDSPNSFEVDVVHVFKNVLFGFDDYSLLSVEIEELEDVYSYLAQNPKLNIAISGHTDDLGADQYNKTLSEKRVKSVGQYLVDRGISKDRISHTGYGSSKPIATNSSQPWPKVRTDGWRVYDYRLALS